MCLTLWNSRGIQSGRWLVMWHLWLNLTLTIRMWNRQKWRRWRKAHIWLNSLLPVFVGTCTGTPQSTCSVTSHGPLTGRIAGEIQQYSEQLVAGCTSSLALMPVLRHWGGGHIACIILMHGIRWAWHSAISFLGKLWSTSNCAIEHDLLLDELLVNKIAKDSYVVLKFYIGTDLLWPLANCYAGEDPKPSDRPLALDIMLWKIWQTEHMAL